MCQLYIMHGSIYGSVIDMVIKVHSNLPGFIKEIDYYMAFHKELKLFLLRHFLLIRRICIFPVINL